MLIHNTSNFSIFFGDQQESFKPKQFYSIKSSCELLEQHQFSYLQNFSVKKLLTLQQTHSTTGFVITHKNFDNFEPYTREGDFLITNIPNTALGIATADCLPIIFYDPKNHALGAAHAGWQGSVQQIATKTVLSLQENFGTKPEDLEIFFGPSAQTCCYEIQENFLENLNNFSHLEQVIEKKLNKLYFNVPNYNQLLLQELGVNIINRDYNFCTICNPKFCSHRRDKELANRQMAIAVLKEVINIFPKN